jgi:hypothetical protein
MAIKAPELTKVQRKAWPRGSPPHAKAKKTGDQIRADLGDWLSGAERRKLLREFGYDQVIAKSYDRAEAKARRRPPSLRRASRRSSC